MHKHRIFILAFVVFAPLAGCRTQLSVTKVETTAQAGQVAPAAAGQVYFLPRVEHVVTLDRELVKCDVRPSINLLAHNWFKEEVANLGSLSEALKRSALQKLNPNCSNSSTPMTTNFGEALPRVRELLLTERLPSCDTADNADADSRAIFEKAYENVFRAILSDFLKDPVLVGGADWGSSCLNPVRSPETLGPSTDPESRSKELQTCSQYLDKSTEVVAVELSILMRASVTAHTLPDMNYAYAIDYLGMSEGTKKTEYTVEKYPNGTLKSVNSTIDDRTAEVIQGTLSGALKLVAASGGFPLALPVAGSQEGATVQLPLTFDQWTKLKKNQYLFTQDPLCNAPVLQLLRQRSDLEAQAGQAAVRILALLKESEEATATAGIRTKEAAELKKELDALPVADPGRKALEDKIEKLKDEAKAQTTKAEQLTKEKAALEKAQGGSIEKLAAIRKQLTITTTHLFRADQSAEETIEGAKEASKAWLDSAALKKYCGEPPRLPCDQRTEIPTALVASTASYLVLPKPTNQDTKGSSRDKCLTRASSGPSRKGPSCLGRAGYFVASPNESKCQKRKKTGESETTGLVYREPAHGLLLVCKESNCLGPSGVLVASPENIVLVTLADFPQAGVLAELPLTNDPFQNNSLTASFSTTGSLEKLSYKSNARAEKAAQAFEGAAGDVLALAEAKQGAKKKTLEIEKAEADAEKALLDAQLAREQSRRALEKLLNPQPPEE